MKNTRKQHTTKHELLDVLKAKKLDVLLTLGAGDIDTLVRPIRKLLSAQAGRATETAHPKP